MSENEVFSETKAAMILKKCLDFGGKKSSFLKGIAKFRTNFLLQKSAHFSKSSRGKEYLW